MFAQEIENLLNQYADDTDMCLDGGDSVRRVFTHLDWFQKNTGCTVNYEKTTLYRIGSLAKSEAQVYTGRKVNWEQSKINVLGIDISTNIDECVFDNYERIVIASKSVLKSWERRSLSLQGRVGIVNTLIASRFVYAMSVLPMMPNKLVQEMNAAIESFLWNGHKPKIPRKVLCAPKSEGGLELIDIVTKDKSLKASWIKSIIEHERILHAANTSLGLVNGFLPWSANLNARDVKSVVVHNSDPFWRHVLESWCEYHFDEEMRDDQIIWFNSLIRIDNKPFFWKSSAEKGLFRVAQLYRNGSPISLKHAKEEYGLSVMQLNSLISAIPKDMRSYAAGHPSENTRNVKSGADKLASVVLSDRAAAQIYKEINGCAGKLEAKAATWSRECNTEIEVPFLKECFLHCFRISNVAANRSFQYRLLHRAIITNVHLFRWGRIKSNLCSFCNLSKETYSHLFFECSKTAIIWDRVKCILKSISGVEYCIKKNVVLFNFHGRDTQKDVLRDLIILLAKKYIYRQRCLKRNASANEFSAIIAQQKRMEKFIAVKNQKVEKHNKKWKII